jgi:hypothetical protein
VKKFPEQIPTRNPSFQTQFALEFRRFLTKTEMLLCFVIRSQSIPSPDSIRTSDAQTVLPVSGAAIRRKYYPRLQADHDVIHASRSPTPPKDCQIIVLSAFYLVIDPACLEVRDSFFSDINSSIGSAIYQSQESGPLCVRDSTFYRCHGSSAGALAHLSGNLEVYRCCIRECWADEWGLALYFGRQASDRLIQESNFVLCESSDAWATISQDSDEEEGHAGSTTMDGLNFSTCQCMIAAVYESDSESASWSFSFSTVLACVSNFLFLVLVKFDTPIQAVRFCNFYNNDVEAGLICVGCYGVSLTSCIFYGNSYSTEFSVIVTGLGSGFRLADCVFSEPLPDFRYVDEVNNVVANVVTASFVLHHFYSHYCPSPDPPSTLSRSLTASSPFTMAAEFGARRKTVRFLLSGIFVIPISCEVWGNKESVGRMREGIQWCAAIVMTTARWLESAANEVINKTHPNLIFRIHLTRLKRLDCHGIRRK